MPYAFEIPIPSEPVFAAMNGVSTSGCPGRPPRRRKRWSSVKSSFSRAIRSEYSAGTSWPFDEKYTSASGAPLLASRNSSVHSQVIKSVELKLDPICPEPAFMIA